MDSIRPNEDKALSKLRMQRHGIEFNHPLAQVIWRGGFTKMHWTATPLVDDMSRFQKPGILKPSGGTMQHPLPPTPNGYRLSIAPITV